MKKNYFLIALFLLSIALTKAQTTLTTATDFTVTDTHGNSHTLFSLLNSGKYVCLDFFFTTCGPCQQTCPFYKETYTNFGCNTQDVYFLSIDNGNTNAEVDAYETTYLGGNSGYPAVSGTQGGGNAVCSAYGLPAYPTYILIAPNKQIVEQDMWPISSAANFTTFFTAHSLTQKTCLSADIAETSVSLGISFYPNPVQNNLTIETTNHEKISRIKIYDVLGKLQINRPVDLEDKYVLNVAELEKGIYYMEITSENNAKITKKMSKW